MTVNQNSGVARRGSDKRGSGETGRNRVWLEQECGRTLIDTLGSSLSLLGDIFRIDLEEEMLGPARARARAQAQGPGPHFLLQIGPEYVSKQAQT